MTVVTFICLSESHLPTIQKKHAKRAGQTELDTSAEATTSTKEYLARSICRPIRMLARSPIITGLSLYLALVYGYLYLLFTTFSTVFAQQYGFDVDALGLSFLGFGVGCFAALVALSWMSDWLQVRLTTKHGEYKPE